MRSGGAVAAVADERVLVVDGLLGWAIAGGAPVGGDDGQVVRLVGPEPGAGAAAEAEQVDGHASSSAGAPQCGQTGFAGGSAIDWHPRLPPPQIHPESILGIDPAKNQPTG